MQKKGVTSLMKAEANSHTISMNPEGRLHSCHLACLLFQLNLIKLPVKINSILQMPSEMMIEFSTRNGSPKARSFLLLHSKAANQ